MKMYKSRLQELCQRWSWELPEYKTARDGPAHMPSFTGSVTVHGQVFETPLQCKSTKEAQNTAARVAFEYFTTLPRPPLQAHHAPDASLPELQPVAAVPQSLPLSSLPSSRPIPPPGTKVVYKNQLQQFTMKNNLGLPMYNTETEGPPHARRFKSSVSVGGKAFVTVEFFSTLKEAEQEAAKVACQELSVDVTQKARDGVSYKNLLQELAQKRGFLCPSYETVQSGFPHCPLFASTVEVGGRTFRGADAKNKKQAELNAARDAYFALTESDTATGYSSMPSISVCADAESSSQNIEDSTTTKGCQDATAEEAHHLQAKRAKYTHGSMNANDDTNAPPGSSEGNYRSDDSNLNPKPVCEQPVEERPGLCSNTVVYPCKVNLPKLESASVLPFSDD